MRSPAAGLDDDDGQTQTGEHDATRMKKPHRAAASGATVHAPSRPSLMSLTPDGRSGPFKPPNKHKMMDLSEKESSALREGMADGNVGRKHSGDNVMSLPSEEEKLMRLREAIDMKIALQQQRKRGSYGARSQNQAGAKRVSPIREEGMTMSPSLAASFSSPDDITAHPMSTASTESSESVRTVRASVPPTPSESRPARTPSYPFPRVPKSFSPSAFHQPFTTLSPTVGQDNGYDQRTPASLSTEPRSGASTPAATNRIFMPPDMQFTASEDPRYPTPNLYDLVLQLNTEPGMEQWWATVVNIMHDHFNAERVTLVAPLDSSDIENAPWGQKATFSMNGPEEFVSRHELALQTSLSKSSSMRPEKFNTDAPANPMNLQSPKLPDRFRPRLETRHSYAGHGRDAKELQSDKQPTRSMRPAGPKRVATHGPETSSGAAGKPTSTQRPGSSSTPRHNSVTDPDFSTVAGVDTGPFAAVYDSMRSLDHENHPLIESHGISRVLQRGRLVTVTRDYVWDSSSSSNDTASMRDSSSTPGSASRLFGNYRSMLGEELPNSRQREYEETEQYPPSPWAQSPAPSPAMQADEATNPFFASQEEQIEDTFNPKSTPKDYSQLGQVEAIGVDRASTVVHLPLIHPALSQPMQAMEMRRASTGEQSLFQRSDTDDIKRKAPIAILSVLSPAVPYPVNLAAMLKLLGPHLATSFAVAQQYSLIHSQSVSFRTRQSEHGRLGQLAPITIEPALFEDIVSAHLDRPLGSRSVGSMTSPSDYSGRSRYSPSGSIIGTPGWDPAAHGWTSSKSQSNTPYTGPEMVDNYFEAKKLRSGPKNSGSAVGISSTHATPQRASKHSSLQDARPKVRRQSPSSEVDSRGKSHEKKSKGQPNARLVHSPPNKPEVSEQEEPPSPGSHSVDLAETREQPTLEGGMAQAARHTLLHSYGADLETSFGGIPWRTGQELPTPTNKPEQHKNTSPSEDMPPPSERLLRTIIDSLPVQIFTARPETGQISWVNSKYLVYRGQEPSQAIKDPWDAIHPQDREGFMAAWYRSLRTSQQLQQKVRLQRFDDSFRWFYVRAAPLRDKRMKIVHWIGTMMDVHEQYNAELNASRQQETAASEAKYRALANSSPQIVFAVSRERGIIFCNTQWLHYSGQTEAHALGVGFMDHVHPDDISKCRLPKFENNSKKPVNVPTSLPIDSRRSSANTVVQSAHGTDADKVSSAGGSSPASQMPQRKLSELASTGILKVTRDADGRPSYSTEVRLKSKEGDYRWHLVRVLLAQHANDGTNEEETWYGTCTDIDDHKALERDLKETMDEKSRFLSNMSHEIRTPLNGITGMVNFLMDSSLTTEQMEHVNIIRASTEGLRGLINDILDLSKAEAGMIQLNVDWLYVRALIEEVNDLTSTMAIDKGLELNYLVDENVPAQIKGDRFRLRQILLNIIGNAIKFTQTGEVFVRCTILDDAENELDPDEIFIQFEVIDTGQGFTEKEAEYLFKRFSQIDGSSTRQHGGTGLGLVISRQLAQLHGGDMSARGAPNKGSTFTFFVKATIPSIADPAPQSTMISGAVNVPLSPTVSHPTETSASRVKATARFSSQITESPGRQPSIEPDRESPYTSSAGSDPSIRSTTRAGSLQSEHSSISSFPSEKALDVPPISLALPERGSFGSYGVLASTRAIAPAVDEVHHFGSPPTSGGLIPRMFSILVVCPLKYSREATVQHISKTLPKNTPHQITARESLLECQRMLGGDEPVTFSHVIVVLQDVGEIIALLDQVLSSPAQANTTIVVITDLAQRRSIVQQSPQHDYDKLQSDRQVRFVFKPLKPSRFAIIFDPQKVREMSKDRNQDSAQQVAVSQKQVFEEVSRRLGNRDKRILLVEDNRVNQLVILKFLAKVSIKAETAIDGVECTEKVFSHPPGYYSIILCDLHMPNKDGYQTCKEIRQWEQAIGAPPQPIIALSANVLGDVYQKCVVAGFNSYMTKPVDFKELSALLVAFMDPADPSKPLEFLKSKPSSK